MNNTSLKRKQSFKAHIHSLELPQFEFLRQILPITLFVLISLLPKFLKTNQKNKIKEIFDPKLGARNSYPQRPDKKITDQGSQITNRRLLIEDHK